MINDQIQEDNNGDEDVSLVFWTLSFLFLIFFFPLGLECCIFFLHIFQVDEFAYPTSAKTGALKGKKESRKHVRGNKR